MIFWKKSFLVNWYQISHLLRQHAFGYGNGRFWVDDVKCTGDEESIDKCSHRPWGRHNCLRYNQAGVICRMHRSDVIVEPKPSKASGEVWLCVLYLWSVLIITPYFGSKLWNSLPDWIRSVLFSCRYILRYFIVATYSEIVKFLNLYKQSYKHFYLVILFLFFGTPVNWLVHPVDSAYQVCGTNRYNNCVV